METKHTKGEWEIQDYGDNGNRQTRIHSNNVTIAKVLQIDEAEANAKLIYSAPLLLEALAKANEELKSIIGILDGRITPELAKTDLGMRLVSFFTTNAFICEEKFEPIIKKATN